MKSKKKPALKLSFNVLYKKENQTWIAHCLELDIVATSNDFETVKKEITDLMITQVIYAIENDNVDYLYHPAPPEVWHEFYKCSSQWEDEHTGMIRPKKTNILDSPIPYFLLTNSCSSEQICYA